MKIFYMDEPRVLNHSTHLWIPNNRLFYVLIDLLEKNEIELF